MAVCHHRSRHCAPPGNSHGSLGPPHRCAVRQSVQWGEYHADAFSVLFSRVDPLHRLAWLLPAGNGSGTTDVAHPETRPEPPCGWSVAHPKSLHGWAHQLPVGFREEGWSAPLRSHLTDCEPAPLLKTRQSRSTQRTS